MEPLQQTSAVFDPTAKVLKVEFLPRPAVVPDYEHNLAQEIQLYRHRMLMDNVIGAVRSNGMALSYGGTDFSLSAGRLFYKEFMVDLASPQAIAAPDGATIVYVHITITRTDTTVDVPGGPILAGPNRYSYSAAIETGASLPVDDATNIYVQLGTTNSDGTFSEDTPLLSVPVSRFCDAKYWEAVQLFESNDPVIVPKTAAKPATPAVFQIESVKTLLIASVESKMRFRLYWEYPAFEVNNEEVSAFQLIVFNANLSSGSILTEFMLTVPASQNRTQYYADVMPTLNTYTNFVHCAVRSVTRSGQFSDWLLLGTEGNNLTVPAPLPVNDTPEVFIGQTLQNNVVGLAEQPLEPGIWYYDGTAHLYVYYQLPGVPVPDPPVSIPPEEIQMGGVVSNLSGTLNQIQVSYATLGGINRQIATAVLESDTVSKTRLEGEKAELLSQLSSMEEDLKTALEGSKFTTPETVQKRVDAVSETVTGRIAQVSQELETVKDVQELSREIPISIGAFSITSGGGAIVDKIPLGQGKIVKASLYVKSVSAAGKVRFYAEGQEPDYKSIEVSAPGLVQGALDLTVKNSFVLNIDVVDGSYQNTVDMTGTLTIFYVKTK